MLPGITGKKIGMTHLFTEDGKMVPVTVLQAGPVYVTQIKTNEDREVQIGEKGSTVRNDGYNAVQIGYNEGKDNKITFPKYGHLKKSGVNKNLRGLKEFRVDSVAGFELGQEITVDIFAEGEVITVTATSKGKGFQGGVKRYHFKGQHMTHGYMTHRRPLSNGATGPQRVFKGSRRPGRMGGETVTQKGLKVVKVDAERNLVLVSGSVPGPNGTEVTINKVTR
ncbi:50S ribosomal protein L3 [bacterium]|nr:MAG: 50S ribosomal protein L3 [bacterium]